MTSLQLDHAGQDDRSDSPAATREWEPPIDPIDYACAQVDAAQDDASPCPYPRPCARTQCAAGTYTDGSDMEACPLDLQAEAVWHLQHPE